MNGSKTPELDNLLGDTQWFTDAAGSMVCRAELVERIAEELDVSLSALLVTVQQDPRKSFSKKKLIELINESMGW